jgi:hypothetical protein
MTTLPPKWFCNYCGRTLRAHKLQGKRNAELQPRLICPGKRGGPRLEMFRQSVEYQKVP